MRIAIGVNDNLISRYLLQRVQAQMPEGCRLELVLHETMPYPWRSRFNRFCKSAFPNFVRALLTNPYWRLAFLEKRAFALERSLLFANGKVELPDGVECRKVVRIGDENSINMLKKQNIDLLFIMGTLPINPEAIAALPMTLGVHFGLLPHYRGLHSQVWAAAKGDRAGLAVTLYQVTEKLAGGCVLDTRRIDRSPLLALVSLRALSVQASAEMMLDFLEHTTLAGFQERLGAYSTPDSLPQLLQPAPLWQRFWAARHLARWQADNR